MARLRFRRLIIEVLVWAEYQSSVVASGAKRCVFHMSGRFVKESSENDRYGKPFGASTMVGLSAGVEINRVKNGVDRAMLKNEKKCAKVGGHGDRLW